MKLFPGQCFNPSNPSDLDEKSGYSGLEVAEKWGYM